MNFIEIASLVLGFLGIFISPAVIIFIIGRRDKKKERFDQLEQESKDRANEIERESIMSEVKNWIKEDLQPMIQNDDEMKKFQSELQTRQNQIEIDHKRFIEERECCVLQQEQIIQNQKRFDKQNKAMSKQYQNIQKTLKSMELTKLAGEVSDYAEDLRRGIEKSEISYRHISKIFDKYKILGGNSYILKEFEYIQKFMEKR